MAWLYLLIAGLLEVLGVICMKFASENKGITPKLILAACFGSSFFFLSKAMEFLPMGTAYAIWTGIGTSGSALVGILVFKESFDWQRLMYLSFIIFGAVGLKLTQ